MGMMTVMGMTVNIRGSLLCPSIAPECFTDVTSQIGSEIEFGGFPVRKELTLKLCLFFFNVFI